MLKRLFSLMLAMVFAFALVPNVSAEERVFTPITGWDMMKKLGIGITFANTTEARNWPRENKSTADTESIWGQPKIEKWHLSDAAEKGFDSYRLCVTWTTHMDKNNKIDPKWMDRIQEIVDWALDSGLNVVLNTHHEEELYWLIRDGKYEEAKKHLNAIWSQVANRFKNYPENLIFETMNEPNLLEYYGGPGEWITENGKISRTLCDTVSKLNKDALATIRGSGGYNDKRVVMLCTPGGAADPLPYMDIPNDPYIVFGVFGYGVSLNKDLMKNIKDMLDKGIGVVNKEDNPSTESWREINLEQYTKDHFGSFSEMGVPSFFFCGSASLEHEFVAFFNRITGEWVNDAILEKYFSAYGKKPSASLMFDSKLIEIGLSESYQLKVKTNSIKTVKWTTSNKSTATVDQKGNVKGLKTGKVTITAAVEGKKAKIEVTIKKAPDKITSENLTVYKDNTAKLKTTFPSGMASINLTYKTSNSKIAKVNAEGVVTGVAAGDCTVTVKTFNGKSVKVNVKVIELPKMSPIGFENAGTQNFTARGGVEKLTETSTQAHSGSKSLLVSGRTAIWHGAQLDVSKYIVSGNSYDISAWIMLKSPGNACIRLSTQIGNSNNIKYFGIDEKTVSNKDGWVKFSGKFTYTEDLSPFDFVTIYVEGGENADEAEYYIDDISFSIIK